jgi:glycosyltransferase involved in cell wall biosynthesis
VSASGPIRVCLLNSAGDVGGGEKHFLNIAEGLTPRGFRFSFVCPYPGRFSRTLTARGWPVHVVDLTRRFSLRSLRALCDLLRAERAQIFHTQGARASFSGRLAARLAKTPVVVSTIQNSLFDYDISSARRFVYLTLERLSSRWADRIICVSEALAADVIGRYGISPEKVEVIPNAIDPDDFHPSRPPEEVRAKLGLSVTEPVVALVGRMTEQKGHVYLLRALPALVSRHPDLRLLIVGDGPLRPTLEAEARALGVHDRCHFVGVREDVADLLAASNVVAVPSLSEGLPYVILEAMAVARPVVASRVSGNPEVVADGKSGILVPPRDVEALAAALDRVLSDPRFGSALGAEGRRRVESEFSLERMLDRIEMVYRGALEGRDEARHP